MTYQEIYERAKYFDYPPLELTKIKNLVKQLNIKFSNDFYMLAKVINFEYFSHFDILNLKQNDDLSVIGDTLRLRRTFGLPDNVVWLSENDASVLLMKCFGDHEEIFWIAMEDVENFCNNKPLQYEATIFPNFTDFFEFLLTKEEEGRGITNNVPQ